jgi:hypothetical protein
MTRIKGVGPFVAMVLHRRKVCSYVKCEASLKLRDFTACILEELLLESK